MSKRNTRTKMESKTNYGNIALIGVEVLVAVVLFTVFTPSKAAENLPQTTTTIVAGVQTATTTLEPNTADIKVEVYHFHGAIQCWSCQTLGALAEKTVNTYFKNELASGKLKFDHINIELAQNAEITNRYGATGSSLMIGVYKGGKFTKEADTKSWYKLNNEEDFLTYLKGVLDKRLKGDLS
jgi:hypothetical protein